MARATDGRRIRSERTRASVIAGATRRFLSHGYVGSTIDDVAEEAGVSVQTVYYIFGTKPKLLAAVLEASIAGDVDSVAVVDRPWVEDMRAASDARAAVTILAKAVVEIIVRTAPIYEVVRRASADPDVDALLRETRRRRRVDQRHLVEILGHAGHLRPNLTADAAADILYGLVNEELVSLFIDDCGWSAKRLREWLTGVLLSQLAGDEPRKSDRHRGQATGRSKIG